MIFKEFDQWQWDIPKDFNIGVACADRHLNTPIADTLAMIVEDDAFGKSQITFKELSQKTNQFAQLLRDLNINMGDRVLVRLPNSLEYPIAFLGAMKMGAVAVPTSTLLTVEEVEYLAKDSGASVLVTDAKAWMAMSAQMQLNLRETPNLKHVLITQFKNEENAQALSTPNLNVLVLEKALSSITDFTTPQITNADDPAYLVYTSGTTGYPKGVLHAHRALLGRQPAAKYWFNYAEDSQDRIMHSGKFNWTYVLGSGLMDPLYCGKTVIVHEGKNDANKWLALIEKHQATIFVGVPTIYRQLLQKTSANQENVSTIRHYMSAGEHLSDDVLNQWKDRFGLDIYEAVGMSEFSYYLSQSIYRPIRAGSAGFAQPGHDIKLLNPDTLKEVPVGEEGMISIPLTDPGVFLKYWNLDEETDKYKHNGYFFTGDYAKYDEDGYIWFLGRKDDIIKSFGYRVSPYEIERVFKGHPDIADCAAIGEELKKDKVLVACYAILKPDAQINPNDLISFAKQHLAAYKVPKVVYFAKDFPRTKNGKILRKEITPTIAIAKSER